MNFEQYKLEAARTEVGRDKDVNFRLKHAAYGLKTEAGELLDIFKKFNFYGKPIDRVNLLEELGDGPWYLNIIADIRQIDLNSVLSESKNYDFKDASIEKLALMNAAAATSIADEIFSVIEFEEYEDGEIDWSKTNHCIEIFIATTKTLAERFGSTIGEILDANIAKLFKRFPEKFTEASAEIRDLVAERATLEARFQDITSGQIVSGGI